MVNLMNNNYYAINWVISAAQKKYFSTNCINYIRKKKKKNSLSVISFLNRFYEISNLLKITRNRVIFIFKSIFPPLYLLCA